jgi:hypothetical protein
MENYCIITSNFLAPLIIAIIIIARKSDFSEQGAFVISERFNSSNEYVHFSLATEDLHS